MGIESLETHQGTSKIILLLRHLRTPGQPHQLIQIVIDQLQYISGLGQSIFEDTTTNLPHLEGVWMQTIRSFLTNISGTLTIADLKIQPWQREGDAYIMDFVLKSKLFSDKEIQGLNYCRLFLQLLTISDICNARGTDLAIGIFQGHKSCHQSISTLEEPLQEQPGEHVWAIW